MCKGGGCINVCDIWCVPSVCYVLAMTHDL